MRLILKIGILLRQLVTFLYAVFLFILLKIREFIFYLLDEIENLTK